ncbi:MAG: hypothetical protein ACXU82_03130 [Caulobacteraceae bacterium]
MSGALANQRREALFRRISGARGGAAAVLLDPAVLAEAEVKMQELKPLVVAEMQAAIGHIRALAAGKAAVGEIFTAAHDVRGLAGAYGFAGTGVVAGAIRVYGENQPAGFEPDWDLLQLLAQMLARTFEHPEAAAPSTLASVCREALGKVMAREGREPPEGAL